MVRPLDSRGGQTMIVTLCLALLIFLYLVYALINPEKF
ncbi:K(+)-transporting ATPase subunit F [Paenibacillus sp. YAF4_2]